MRKKILKILLRNLIYPITIIRQHWFYDEKLVEKRGFIRWEFGKSHVGQVSAARKKKRKGSRLEKTEGPT